MSKEIRTFIAVKLTDEIISQIANLQEELKSTTKEKIKWVNPKNMHVTLKFIGEIPEKKLEDIFEATKLACQNVSPFDLSLENLGVFPNFRRPKVIWVGISEGKNQLKRLAENIDEELHKFGFPKEKRGFKAHLTLARIKYEAPQTLLEQVKEKLFSTPAISIDSVHIIKSDLRPAGPIYTSLMSIDL